MHAASETGDRLRIFNNNLKDSKLHRESPFLLFEMEALIDRIWPEPTNFISSTIGRVLLKQRFSCSFITLEKFVSDMMIRIEEIVVKVLTDNAKEYQQLFLPLRKIAKMWAEFFREDFQNKVDELIELEKSLINICREGYRAKVQETIKKKLVIPEGTLGKKFINIEGFGDEIQVNHLKNLQPGLVKKAFELKMLTVVYWDFIADRLVDNCVVGLNASIKNMLVMDTRS